MSYIDYVQARKLGQKAQLSRLHIIDIGHFLLLSRRSFPGRPFLLSLFLRFQL